MVDEYLAALFERSFDREAAQEEHVVNSLPFFIAALALAGAVLGFLVDKLPPFDLSPYCLLVYGLMGLSGASMASVLPPLFVAVRQRVFQIPPKETEIQAWADALRDYYFGHGQRGDRLQETVVR
jgi:hypothetical protein